MNKKILYVITVVAMTFSMNNIIMAQELNINISNSDHIISQRNINQLPIRESEVKGRILLKAVYDANIDYVKYWIKEEAWVNIQDKTVTLL